MSCWHDNEPSVTTHLIGEGRIAADSLVPGVHIVPEQRNQPEVTIIIVIATNIDNYVLKGLSIIIIILNSILIIATTVIIIISTDLIIYEIISCKGWSNASEPVNSVKVC